MNAVTAAAAAAAWNENTQDVLEHFDDYPQKLGAEQKTPICNFISHHEKMCDAKKPHHDHAQSRNYVKNSALLHMQQCYQIFTSAREMTLIVASQWESFLHSRFTSPEWMMRKECVCVSRPQPATTFDIAVDISQNWHLFSSLNWTKWNSLNNFCFFLNCPYDWCVRVQVALPPFFHCFFTHHI